MCGKENFLNWETEGNCFRAKNIVFIFHKNRSRLTSLDTQLRAIHSHLQKYTLTLPSVSLSLHQSLSGQKNPWFLYVSLCYSSNTFPLRIPLLLSLSYQPIPFLSHRNISLHFDIVQTIACRHMPFFSCMVVRERRFRQWICVNFLLKLDAKGKKKAKKREKQRNINEELFLFLLINNDKLQQEIYPQFFSGRSRLNFYLYRQLFISGLCMKMNLTGTVEEKYSFKPQSKLLCFVSPFFFFF